MIANPVRRRRRMSLLLPDEQRRINLLCAKIRENGEGGGNVDATVDKIHVLLVREWDQQMSGSGCCGRLEGDMTECRGEKVFKQRRAKMEQMGAVYRSLYESFPGQIDVEVVDPRNMIALTAVILREQRKRDIRVWQKVKQLISGLNCSAIYVNGELVFTGEVPSPNQVVSAIEKMTKDKFSLA